MQGPNWIHSIQKYNVLDEGPNWPPLIQKRLDDFYDF